MKKLTFNDTFIISILNLHLHIYFNYHLVLSLDSLKSSCKFLLFSYSWYKADLGLVISNCWNLLSFSSFLKNASYSSKVIFPAFLGRTYSFWGSPSFPSFFCISLSISLIFIYLSILVYLSSSICPISSLYGSFASSLFLFIVVS